MPGSDVEAHYTRGDLHAAILAGLAATGKDPEHLGPDDIGPVEEFHTLGRLSTMALAQTAGLGPDDHVLDAGCGLGGPARTLARNFGCRVTGVDLTAEYCTIARDLTARSGLADRIGIVAGTILDLPFAAGTFDVAWSQHVAMNIADKPALYRSLRAALRPGGRLAFFDVVAGPAAPIHVPVPWAEDLSLSFLESAPDTRRHVEAAGFAVREWTDLSQQATAFWLGARQGGAGTAAAPLGVHLLMADLPTKVANMGRNLQEDRIRLVLCVADAI